MAVLCCSHYGNLRLINGGFVSQSSYRITKIFIVAYSGNRPIAVLSAYSTCNDYKAVIKYIFQLRKITFESGSVCQITAFIDWYDGVFAHSNCSHEKSWEQIAGRLGARTGLFLY